MRLALALSAALAASPAYARPGNPSATQIVDNGGTPVRIVPLPEGGSAIPEPGAGAAQPVRPAPPAPQPREYPPLKPINCSLPVIEEILDRWDPNHDERVSVNEVLGYSWRKGGRSRRGSIEWASQQGIDLRALLASRGPYARGNDMFLCSRVRCDADEVKAADENKDKVVTAGELVEHFEKTYGADAALKAREYGNFELAAVKRRPHPEREVCSADGKSKIFSDLNGPEYDGQTSGKAKKANGGGAARPDERPTPRPTPPPDRGSSDREREFFKWQDLEGRVGKLEEEIPKLKKADEGIKENLDKRLADLQKELEDLRKPQGDAAPQDGGAYPDTISPTDYQRLERRISRLSGRVRELERADPDHAFRLVLGAGPRWSNKGAHGVTVSAEVCKRMGAVELCTGAEGIYTKPLRTTTDNSGGSSREEISDDGSYLSTERLVDKIVREKQWIAALGARLMFPISLDNAGDWELRPGVAVRVFYGRESTTQQSQAQSQWYAPDGTPQGRPHRVPEESPLVDRRQENLYAVIPALVLEGCYKNFCLQGNMGFWLDRKSRADESVVGEVKASLRW